jgi:centrin-3
MKALGFDLQKQEVLALLQEHGVPLDTVQPPARQQGPSNRRPRMTFTGTSRLVLSFDAFQRIMAQKIIDRDPREEILRAFELFDTSGKGKIGIEELKKVAKELGEGLSEEEMASMIDEFDLDGDGMITREEFVDICLS